jgi:hypothetical protein
MRTNLTCVVVAMLCAGAFACGGGVAPSGAAPAATNDDAGDEGGPVTTPVEAGVPVEAAAPVNHGAPSTTYPAFPVSFGQLENNGGYIMKAPVIVAITWTSDASQASFDTFADEIGGTSYWNQTAGAWGIGPATSGTVNHVQIATPPPATMTESQSTSDFQNMINTYAGAANGWPEPTVDTIYAFFLAPGTSVQLPNQQGTLQDACAQGIGGYHQGMQAGLVPTAYAVVPSCTFPGTNNTAAQQTSMSMSHEINEAASDPQPNSGIYGFVNNSFAFDYFQDFQSEDADACEFFDYGPDSSFYEDIETTPAPFDYWVQRVWSNKSGAAGHNPCVPVPADPYFNVTPLDLQTVNVSFPGQLTGSSTTQQVASKGYKILAGASATFGVGLYSDAATSGPWTIHATAGNPITGSQDPFAMYNPSSLTVSLDKSTGTNGDIAYVTVKVASTGTLFKGELVTITSALNGSYHYMPIWIAGQ